MANGLRCLSGCSVHLADDRDTLPDLAQHEPADEHHDDDREPVVRVLEVDHAATLTGCARTCNVYMPTLFDLAATCSAIETGPRPSAFRLFLRAFLRARDPEHHFARFLGRCGSSLALGFVDRSLARFGLPHIVSL